MKKVALLGGSLNPPGLHHRAIARALSREFDLVRIVPCGPRPDKATTNDIAPLHRAAMADLAFQRLASNIEVELFDLEQATFTPNHLLGERLIDLGEVWHVVGTDLVAGGGEGRSFIQRSWAEGWQLWAGANFVIALGDDEAATPKDYPPRHRIVRFSGAARSTLIRERVFRHEPYEHLVTPEVAAYIARYDLYRGRVALTRSAWTPAPPGRGIVLSTDGRNPRTATFRERLEPLVANSEELPTVIVVVGGDGIMLHAVREFWRRRTPFFGINAGHLGFLMNEVRPGEIGSDFFARQFILRSSPLLFVEAVAPDGAVRHAHAMNDAYVAVEQGKTGWFEIEVDGEVRIPRLVGDGALVATAAGSTAYARAMGANPVPIGTEVLLTVGSNVAEPIGWKSANLPQDSSVIFRTADPSRWRKTFGYADGVALGEVVELRVRSSRIAAAELLFLPENDIRKKLARTQFPHS
ncbi:MAG: NAD(+)/NADH kinase [bacterium]|nr:NAD(+)/NADH kinase [bacterium]